MGFNPNTFYANLEFSIKKTWMATLDMHLNAHKVMHYALGWGEFSGVKMHINKMEMCFKNGKLLQENPAYNLYKNDNMFEVGETFTVQLARLLY